MIAEQAVQCGYCFNGQIIKGAELLFKTPQPTEAQIRSAMNGHICRCGTYPRIMSAIQRAAQAMASSKRSEGVGSHFPARQTENDSRPHFDEEAANV
jgi:xanthine dehydrogenase iron-sulfur cluster and FAD-binding subunit A